MRRLGYPRKGSLVTSSWSFCGLHFSPDTEVQDMRHKVFIRGGHYKTSLGPTGGEATGPVLLSRDPILPLEAATKQYADSKANNVDASAYTAGIIAAERLPAFTGDIVKSEGSSIINIANIGVSAGSYTKVTVNLKGQVTAGTVLVENDIPDLDWGKVTTDKPTTLAGYGITDALGRSNPVMTGPLKVNGPFVDDFELVNKEYVDNTIVSRSLVGDIDYKLVAATPAKFLRCNGGEVSKTTYAALYAVIGDQFGGDLMPGVGKPWKQQYAFNSIQSTDITGWTTGTSLPGALTYSQAIVTKNRVYLLGGYNGSVAVTTVYTAPINADGTLGSWTTGTSLPGSLYGSQAIVTKNRVYLLGGVNSSGGVAVATVYSAPINEDGTLGTWTTGTSLPGALYTSQAIVTKNRVYLLGGHDGSIYITTVYSAPINEDGTIGTWTTGTSLPGSLYGSQAIVTKNRVYLLGGLNSTTVYTAPINEDGTLGTWTTGTSLPGVLYTSQAIVTKNRVYLLGGRNSSSYVSTVYTAPINEDSTLGAWTTGTSLPGALVSSQAIVTKNRVYLLGGYNGSAHTSTVYTAPFSGGSNDYTMYYNDTIGPVASGNFRLPNITSPYPNSYAYIRYQQ